MLRIITSLAYLYIKNQQRLFDRDFIFEQSQYRNMLYVKLSSLHKLKIRYTIVFKKISFNKNKNFLFYRFLMKIISNNYS